MTVLLLSYSVARLGLAPLTRLTRDAQNVRPNNRSQRLDPRSLPFDAAAERDSYPLEVDGEQVMIGAVSLGNPHAVLAGERVATLAQLPNAIRTALVNEGLIKGS